MIRTKKGDYMKPLIPMLAITGKPQIEDITQMFQAYQKVGIDAVMLYPRSGLEIEYMSEEWRQFCYEVICVINRDNHCVQEVRCNEKNFDSY